MDISVSDMRKFNRCSRQWNLTSPNRQNLSRMVDVKEYFLLGSIYHGALDILKTSVPGTRIQSAVRRSAEHEFNELREAYRKSVGTAMSKDEEAYFFNDIQERVTEMLIRYVDQYGVRLLPDNQRYIHSEVTLRAPIPGSKYEGTDDQPYLVATLDGVIADTDTWDLWVTDHKTFSRVPSRRDLEFDDQFRAYVWLLRQVAGVRVAGAIYDGMSKKPPTKPRVLKNGTMSLAKISTTERVYTAALVEAGLDPADYADKLAEIREAEASDENAFFHREEIEYNDASLEEIVVTLNDVHDRMLETVDGTPVRPYNGCVDCTVRALCEAMTNDEDVDYVRSSFVRGDVYGTFSKTPVERLTLDYSDLQTRPVT